MILLNSGIGNYVISNGKRYSYFGGNNYLGLAGHPAVKEASIKATEKYGVNFSASRITSGTADIHLELESKLSEFKGKQDAVVFASGYLGNSILLEVLKGRYTAVFIDQYAHPSLTTALHCDNKDIHYYNHCDAEHLEDLLVRHKGSSPLIMTDGIFALTGEIAPLDTIYPLIVDDAHSTGILGKNGKGTPEYFNLQDDENIFQSETMSKALGGYGGFISGSTIIIDSIREKSAIYLSSTALPPSVVAAGIASLEIIKNEPGLRVQMLHRASGLRKEIAGLGFYTNKDETPIIPVMFSEKHKAMGLSSFLEDSGIIVPFMNYPSKQDLHILRIAVSAGHTDSQADELTGIRLALHEWLHSDSGTHL